MSERADRGRVRLGCFLPGCHVSLDVFFHGFIAGESSERGGAQMREMLAPHITPSQPPLVRTALAGSWRHPN